ncbi:MAG: hypothetical protein L6R40_007156 [Gallowayella cf. fulva]|nr:MAG: hypothetical protein L6R40_007156 [Xanthomendoza cf. fulva]
MSCQHRITTYSSANSEKVNLTLPIIPAEHPDFDVEMTYNERYMLTGVELVSSLATSIAESWRDTANQKIESRITERQRPFVGYQYIIQPSRTLGADLTPLKVGLAKCHILQDIFSRTRWPEFMVAKITGSTIVPYHRSVDIGYVKVQYSPLSGPADATAVAAATAYTTSTKSGNPAASIDSKGLSIPIMVEKRWLICFTQFLLFVVQHPASGSVTDEPTMSAKQEKHTYQIACGQWQDRFDITIYPEANAQSAWGLSWDRLMRAMLVWIADVATKGQYRYLQPEVVKEGGIRQATLSIRIDIS